MNEQAWLDYVGAQSWDKYRFVQKREFENDSSKMLGDKQEMNWARQEMLIDAVEA